MAATGRGLRYPGQRSQAPCRGRGPGWESECWASDWSVWPWDKPIASLWDGIGPPSTNSPTGWWEYQ